MNKSTLTMLSSMALCVCLFGSSSLFGPARAAALETEKETLARSVEPPMSTDAQMAMVSEYCMVCHNDTGLAGGMSLETFDAVHPESRPELAEKMIRKLKAGMMPPYGFPRPEDDEIAALAASLESRMDQVWEENPNPGRRVFQRLNRAEYERSVKDLLDIDVDVNAFLPPDTVSHSFDNVSDVQNMSATLLEGYMRAAGAISRAVVGEPNADAREVTYKLPRIASQMGHVEGAPLGTRGGISRTHNFPADGDYIFKVQLHGTPTGFLYGNTVKGEQLEISINGGRVTLLDIDAYITESTPGGLILESEPVHIQAGPHRVSAAFIERFTGPVDDLMRPIEHTLADTTIGRAYGVTTLPHLRFFSVNGPHDVTGVSETPSRRLVFSCRPTNAEGEIPCAQEIITRLATRAYRRPLEKADTAGLMAFYRSGSEQGDFESGVRTAIQAMLASPQFVFRLERATEIDLGASTYQINDFDLASRLSYFLWATAPDDELLGVAASGELGGSEVLSQQIGRMLADERAEAMGSRFASQWLRLQDLDGLDPNYLEYPQYDAKLAEGLKRETELFFENLVREDGSVFDLLQADYSFLNERVAAHYGIPNVVGNEFRRVDISDTPRRGILGHGSILTLTSIADRTSPVQRGKWVLEVMLGTPPPPPPPNIPDLEAVLEGAERALSVREQMEMHRSNPACNSCHRMIDPLGLALENFDVTGAWRIRDHGVPIDSSGELYDGTPIEGPTGLRQALIKYSDPFIMSFTESLMTYGLGRRVEYYDMPAIRKIVREAKSNDYRISSFLRGVVESEAFRKSLVEEDLEQATAGEIH